jgi:hypothetical protein
MPFHGCAAHRPMLTGSQVARSSETGIENALGLCVARLRQFG